MERVNPLVQVTFVENGDERYVGYVVRKTTRGWELFNDLSVQDRRMSYPIEHHDTDVHTQIHI